MTDRHLKSRASLSNDLDRAHVANIRTGHQSQLSAGDACSAIVVRMQADNSCLTIAQVSAEPFDLVCMNIWCRDFNGDRKIQDDFVLRSWLPHVNNSFADLKCEIYF